MESLYRYFPAELIQTYLIYKVELFAEQYESVFRKYPECVVIEERDFHSDVMGVLRAVDTEYILFGIDDVVFFDRVDFDLIRSTFAEHANDIFGFTLRFGPESLVDSGDTPTELTVAGQRIYRLNWKNGRSAHVRYPFELCCTFYLTALVRKVITSLVSSNPVARRLFSPSSVLIHTMSKVISTRSVLKSFGYFFSPNTFESWLCRWCQNHPDDFPGYTYFQKLCASAVQVNMVNTSTKNTFDGTLEHTVEALNDKYRQGYHIDIGLLAANKPKQPSCGQTYFRLVKT